MLPFLALYRFGAQPPQLFQKLLAWSGEGWAVKTFGHIPAFVGKLEEMGFRELEVREISWNIGPTALHSPLLVARVLMDKWLTGERLCPTQWKHFRSGMVAPLVGLFRQHFGYFLITGRR